MRSSFCRAPSNLLNHWIYVEVLLIESYLEGALQKELRIARLVERFEIATLRRFC